MRDVYDKAKYHLRDHAFRRDVPESHAYVPGGLLFGWLAVRGWLASWMENELGRDLDALRSGQLTGPRAWARVGGVLDRSTVRAEIVPFLDWLYFEGENLYFRWLVDDLAERLPSVYHIAGTRSDQADTIAALDFLYQHWKSEGR